MMCGVRGQASCLTACWWLATVCRLSAQAPAAPSLKRLSLEQLSQIEITSPSKVPEDAFRVPMAVYVITGSEIQRFWRTTIPEALRLAPGVEGGKDRWQQVVDRDKRVW